ncbi:glycosyltransferase family 4 protein [Sphingomonas bacterium]|uniref:glycosyltransferase family 4 protein n=1 Tax=Sphingomonas bacterium TaxID=1895847 RepID=UPI001575F3FB|nr:glycosyltransferase family 4 protein [Sphingomonas bacterium]
MTAPVRRRRLAYLTNIPSPYRRDMAAAWAALNPELSLSVFYTDADDQGRGWRAGDIGGGVVERRLPIVLETDRYGKLNRGLRRMVARHDIVMLGGFEQASYLAAGMWARVMRKPVILLFDGFSPARFGHEGRAILALKRATARLADGFFANGIVGERYLREQIGIPASRPVFNQYLSHADAAIAAARRRWTGASRQEVRRYLGVPLDGPLLLSCGYLIERKRVDCTIDAIARLPEAGRPGLLVVGSGPLEEALRARARACGVATHFAGFRQADALADYYFAADALVLSSRDDPWGLVVNEAMSAGLPVIVSDACGAASDLVHDGSNGFVFAAQDVDALAAAIARLLAADREAMGERSRAIIGEWTPSHSARSLDKVVRAVMPEG